MDPNEVELVASTEFLDVYNYLHEKKYLFGLLSEQKNLGRVVDKDGIVRLKVRDMVIANCVPQTLETEVSHLVDRTSSYKEGGKLMPNIFILHGAHIVDLSGLVSTEQIVAIGQESIAGIAKDSSLIIIADKR